MPHNKKHHYVPKFYLRNFSADRSGIGIFNIPSRRLIPCGNLSNQCYRNYFYGKQPTIEHALGGIESAASGVIRGMLTHGATPPRLSAAHIILAHFVVLQAARTAYEADATAEATDKFFKTVYGTQFGDLSDYQIGFEDPVLMSLRIASQIVPVTYDLKIKLLRNETGVGFITSDNPVVRHNQYYEGNNHFGQTGWAQAGLQVFLPLSRKYVCVLYDSETYKVGTQTSGSAVVLNAREDVDTLNALQWLNAFENVYFFSAEEQTVSAQAQSTLLSRRRSEKTSILEHAVYRRQQSDDQPDVRRSVMHEFRPGLNYRLKVGAIRLRRRRKHARFDDRAAPVRDADYLQVTQEFGKLLSQRKVRPEEFMAFARRHPLGQAGN